MGKTVAIIQARMGSTRLPGKVMRDLHGMPLIGRLVERLSPARRIDQIVIATSEDAANDPLVEYAATLGISTWRGSETDVLERFLGAARNYDADVVVRITGDCPLVDPELVDQVVEAFEASPHDYASNIEPATFPDGLDVEVFTLEALERAARETDKPYDHEHVTPYLRTAPGYRRVCITNDVDLSHLRWTVDEPVDLEVVRAVFAAKAPDIHFSWRDVLALNNTQESVFASNLHIKRNEGATMGSGQKLWKRAKNVIPGGNMLLSKRAEMMLPEHWPAYFSKTSGATVWDLDGNAYIDTFLMGVGTNTLGYSHPEVDEAVMQVVASGNLSTFNAPEEVYLAERLIALHPWADMARFTRSGGEANAVAIRIARAASGRDKVAFCGYHGWHDWYLAANLGNGNTLAGHLLPGLEPKGVPQELYGSIRPFQYNDLVEFETAISDPEVGVIFMEVSRNAGPNPGFLEEVRRRASERNIVLVFDECTSGFRQTYGGLHKLYGVEPDMATFGKTLGNGYAVAAIIGRREIMEAAQTTFISSTFWTERIGSAAGVKTLEVMERERSWEKITEIGNSVRKRWQGLADTSGISITHWGLPALCGFTVNSDNALAYKTLITQEMLKKGYLAGNSLYASLAHTPAILDGFFENLAPVFDLIASCEAGKPVSELLDGPVAHAGFKRLN
ncbi:aminotransferase class III-fold pyridoxal phosphate-dependent enzyme [Devosia sediminis]|uniref:Aminotransferase class III-fold pyridoxal phosphate-dependent enzyme n=1 Tax=Devosia sediminis TaxID=2798801 RepID=A0A934MHG5_9HYPH|nr:aminotransferase class III-fold pyridoxal phosphate-dependent enzyme [Devosia sediminis]MBJ3785057.1 aminotransferase class III-fold pyridoxal phosphate-dependent enzyme [Devosia sediminis]